LGSINVDDCGFNTGFLNGRGDVWYKFVAPIDGGWFTASTCSGFFFFYELDSLLRIYGGGCGNLTCITGNDNFFGEPSSGLSCSAAQAVASWFAEANSTYFIRVSAGGNAFGNDGAFGIIIKSGQVITPPAPDNDSCANATALELGVPVPGTTVGASLSPGVPFCDGAEFPPSPGVFYSTVGDGQILTASTCTELYDATNAVLDTRLSVYEASGDCETDMICIAGNDDYDHGDCDTLLSRVSWQSKVGVNYLIHVYGYDIVGSFAVVVISGETP